MNCPSCGFKQADDRLDCECCGLIFAKWKEKHLPPPAILPVEEAPASALENPQNTSGDSPDQSPSRTVVEASAPGNPETPSGGTQEQSLPLPPEPEPFVPEAAIPDNPAQEPYIPGQGSSFYGKLASLDFQKTLDGEWIYFPWDFFGKGYRLNNPETKKPIERMVTRFCCVHSPMTAMLGLSAVLNFFYRLENRYVGLIFFAIYIPVAYLFLWLRARQLTRYLPVSEHYMNQKYYSSLFSGMFKLRLFIEPEILFLILTLSCLWLWLTEKWRWLFDADGIIYLWAVCVICGFMLAFISFLRYFRKK